MDASMARELLSNLISVGGLLGFKVGGFAFVVGYGFAVLLGLFNYITK